MAGPLRKPRTKSTAQQEEGENRFAVHLSKPATLILCAVFLVASAWSFFMGFMVGRGQNPEAHLEQMTGLRVKDAPVQLPQESTIPSADAATSAPSAEKAPTPPPAPNPPQEQRADNDAQKQPEALAKQHATGEARYPFARPSGSSLAAWGQQQASPQDTGKQKENTSRKSQSAQVPTTGMAMQPTGGPIYDATYQVAAFKGPKDAAHLCQTLKERGIRAFKQKSGKVLLVLVNLHGTDADALSLRKTLQAMGLGAPVLLSRKAVTAGPAKKRH